MDEHEPEVKLFEIHLVVLQRVEDIKKYKTSNLQRT